MIGEEAIRQMLDEDLVLTIFDRVKAPAYHEVRDADLLAVLNSFDFHDRRRIRRYQNYANIRRFLAPLYHEHAAEISKFMYGDGVMEYFATRQASGA